jgi:transposase
MSNPNPSWPGGRRSQLSQEHCQKIIKLLLIDQISVENVAIRFNVSKMTIIRVRREHLNSLDARKGPEEIREKFKSRKSTQGISPA